MLRSCFSSIPISEEVHDSSVACLTHGLKHYGVCPSYVSLTGDSSLIRSSGNFCRNWDFLHRGSAKQERNEGLNVSLNAPYFISLDGKLPYSLLLFQNILKTLHVKMCSIESLPETFGHNLCQLLFLDLSCNKLCCLPNSICSISTLKHLNVSRNSLVSLPMDIGLIRDLEVLNVSHNDIKVLPTSLVNCSKIQVLDLQGNLQLQTIPHDLSLRLKKLHTLLL
jgi:Leucine-rich repeat (LRR) protein